MATSADLDTNFPGPPRLSGTPAEQQAAMQRYLDDTAERLRTFTETVKQVLQDNEM
jgi:ketosteroid isomerase-like protein